MAMMLITALRHNNAPMPSFWRNLIRTFQRRAMGMETTASISPRLLMLRVSTNPKYLSQCQNIGPISQPPRLEKASSPADSILQDQVS